MSTGWVQWYLAAAKEKHSQLKDSIDKRFFLPQKLWPCGFIIQMWLKFK